MCECLLFVFFFKQKTAYEIRNCDWSSDVCSSDLRKEKEREEKLKRGAEKEKKRKEEEKEKREKAKREIGRASCRERV